MGEASFSVADEGDGGPVVVVELVVEPIHRRQVRGGRVVNQHEEHNLTVSYDLQQALFFFDRDRQATNQGLQHVVSAGALDEEDGRELPLLAPLDVLIISGAHADHDVIKLDEHLHLNWSLRGSRGPAGVAAWSCAKSSGHGLQPLKVFIFILF